MIVLPDTCVWSLALRRQSRARQIPQEQFLLARFNEAIRDGRVAMIGPIRQEILSGIRDKAQFGRIEKVLAPFRDEKIDTDDYIEAAHLFNVCRDQGVQCGPIDILICAVANRRNFEILTNDQGLGRCISVLQSKGLMH